MRSYLPRYSTRVRCRDAQSAAQLLAELFLGSEIATVAQ